MTKQATKNKIDIPSVIRPIRHINDSDIDGDDDDDDNAILMIMMISTERSVERIPLTWPTITDTATRSYLN